LKSTGRIRSFVADKENAVVGDRVLKGHQLGTAFDFKTEGFAAEPVNRVIAALITSKRKVRELPKASPATVRGALHKQDSAALAHNGADFLDFDFFRQGSRRRDLRLDILLASRAQPVNRADSAAGLAIRAHQRP
jgi:hypothetical protein